MQNQELKRISLLLREDQYKELNKKNINLSGLIRDLLDDHLSESKVTLAVSDETAELYNTIISDTGSSDSQLEKHFRKSLKDLLNEKIKYMQDLSTKIN
tara:strand:- start:147529 stop:147825 length:297 start_codon:yes stop_codon:yes gene_type:complete